MKLKRILALVLAFCMVFSSMSFSAFAEGETYVAKVGDVECADATAMISALNSASGEVVVEIYGKVVTTGFSLNNSNITKLSFVAKSVDAEICVDGVSYIDVRYTNYPIDYNGLILSHVNAGQNIDGFLPQYFSTYSAGDVTYTKCTFPNGVTACGSVAGTTYTFSECTFNNTTSGLYSLWVYGNSTNVVVNGGDFCGVRGIKLYSEGSDDFSSLSVSEATFSETITEKHAVVLTKGESVTLTDNTFYNTTGIVQVDDDCASSIEGKTVTIDGTVYTVDSEKLDLEETAPAYVATVNGVEVATFAEVLTAVKGSTGNSIVLLAEASVSGQNALDALTGDTLDLNGNTLTVDGNSYFSDGITTFKNGHIVVTGYASDSYFCGYTEGAVIVFDNVVITGDDYKTGCALINANQGKVEIKNSEITVSGDTNGGVIYGGAVTIENTDITATNVCRGITNSVAEIKNESTFTFDGGETGFNNSTVTVDNSVVEIKNATMRAVRLANNTLALQNSATLTATGCAAGIVAYNESSTPVVNVDASSTLNAENTITPSVATVNGVGYPTIKEAIDAANAGDTVTLLTDVTGDVTVNKAITLDGNNLTIAGKLSVTADGATVKNATVNNGSSTAGYISAKDVLIENCTVTGGNGFRYCYTSGTVTFRDSTITGSTYGIHFDGNAGGNIVIDNCTITGWTSFAGTITKVTIKDSEFEKGNYNQLRFYQDSEITDTEFNEDMTIDFGKNDIECVIENCTVSDGSPITDVIYLADLATMGIEVTINDEPYTIEAGVKTGDDTEYYTTLAEALKNVGENSVVTLYADITVSELWDCRYNGAKITVPVTIDGNGHTIKLTGSVNDKNWNTVFRFEKDATVKNLTIDASEASDIQRGISAKYSITVDNCKLIGNGTSAKRGVIFGEGAGSELPNVTATITGSTFTGWSYGVSDNQSGKDAKSVSVTDSTFTDASVLVSAAETVTFTGNTVTGGYVNISSYTAADTVAVIATGNTLEGEFDIIQTNPENITADDEFITPVAKIGSKYYETLSKAISKANDGDTIELLKTVVIDEDMTLDLNGYTVMGNIVVEAGATVEIKNGTIICKDGNYDTIKSLGNLTLTNVNADGERHIVRAKAGTLTINGGTYKYTGSATGTRNVINIGDYENGQVVSVVEATINGGTFIGPKGTSADSGAALTVQSGSTATVYGGTFSNGKNSTLATQDGATITVYGGYFDQDPTSYVADGYVASGDADGTLYMVTAERTLRLVPSATEVKTGNTFTVDVYIDTADVWEVEWVLEYNDTLFEIVEMTTPYTNWGDATKPALYATNSAIDETKPVATYTFKKNTMAATDSDFTFKFTEISILTDYESVNNITVPCNDAEFSIKIKLDYVVEVDLSKYSYYISGKKLVLVYTNATGITFDYDGIQMYEVTGAGYKYSGEESFTQTADTKVYALVVDTIDNGIFEEYKANVLPDYLETATVIIYDKKFEFKDKLFDNDVSGDSKVKQNDITNVYLVAVCNEIALGEMDIMLKADVDGDKQVNMFDAESIINELYGK